MRPVTYTGGGRVLGHYAVAQRSGEIAATPAALAHYARIRNGDAIVKVILMRVKVGLTVSAAITAAVETAFRAIIVRGFTVDFSSNITNINLSSVSNTNEMRNEMSPSVMGTSGPGILTTAAMSGQTMTADNAPFAIATYTNPSTTLGASAVTNQIGCGVPMTTLYEWTGLGQHPVLLNQNEGVVIQPMLTGHATGTAAVYVQWEWAEVLAF